MSEFEFLKIISNKLSDNSYIGDDCAYLKEYNLVLSMDSLIEDVHFSCFYMTPKEIASKALLSNISDILASGAKPNYALISLGGKLDNKFVEEFYLSINETALKYDIKIIGGDLVKSDKITISICILGETKNRNISKRSNAKEGYIIGTMGEFGSSSEGLNCLQNNIKDDYYINIHKNPKLYPNISDLIAKNTKNPYAMMDSSDGLFDCLNQISLKSKVKIDINYDKILKKSSNRENVLFGGEDYCLVFALSKEDFNNINKIKPLNQIGYCSSGIGVFVDNIQIKENKGFKHFD